MKAINVKLDPNKDSDLIEFLTEKDATTFIVKESLRMYIKAYSNLGSAVSQSSEVVEEKNTQKGKKFFNK